MRRVVSIIGKAEIDTTKLADRVVLDSDDRQRRRIVLTGEQGTTILLDFEKPVTLRDGDGLVLEDGSIVQVAGQAERLLEIMPSSPRDLVRLAWHLGNRHTDVQFADGRIRIRYDHVLEEMLRGLGARTTTLDAAFDPEAGAPQSHDDLAYDHDAQDHDGRSHG